MAVRRFEGIQPDLHPTVYVDELALVSGAVKIGADSSVWPMSVVRGDVNHIEIGARTNIQDGCVLHVTHDSEFAEGGMPLRIGDGVTVGHKAVLHACTIEDGCLIGMGAIVLDGAVVRRGAIVGAGALVPPNKELEGGCLYVGAPVKRVRELTAKEKQFLDYSAEHYVQLKNRHRQSG
ncbi:MAG TPA: gamma carbonic anhydrase family protein [Gammaproteobacteria bacterium]|nr:gamma carbonic anhydrase family protein [Gammaproteobacteria bacterium]